MEPQNILEQADLFKQQGVNVNINKLIKQIGPDEVYEKIDKLEARHILSLPQIIGKISPQKIVEDLDVIQSLGVNPNMKKLYKDLMKDRDYDLVALNLDKFLQSGVKVNIKKITKEANPGNIAENLTSFINAGASIDINQLIGKLLSGNILRSLDELIQNGAKIDVNQLVDDIKNPERNYIIANSLDKLLKHGLKIDVDSFISELDPFDISSNMPSLYRAGVDVDSLIEKFSPADFDDNKQAIFRFAKDIKPLLPRINSEVLLQSLHPTIIARRLEDLVQNGIAVDVNDLAKRLDYSSRLEHLDTLKKYGYKPEEL